MINYRELTECVACGGSDLATVLNLGRQPLANNFTATPTWQETFPLVLKQCASCTHLQLSVSVDPTVLFRRYIYRSGTSTTLREYSVQFAKTLTDQHGTGTVLDVACNDGTQLDALRQHGWATFGVDPAENLALYNTHPKRVSFFDESCRDLGDFDVIVAQNVVAHTPDPLTLLTVARDLAPVMYVQTSQAHMVERNEFDTIYHEHISFFSPQSMRALAERAGWVLTGYTITDIHGGSFVFTLERDGEPCDTPGAGDTARFARNAKKIIRELRAVIDETPNLVGYGAAAKAMTVLNAVGAGPRYIVDDAPEKAHTFTPGLGIPVLPSSVLADEPNEIALLPLAWNFHDEISSRVQAIYGKPFETLRYFPAVEWA